MKLYSCTTTVITGAFWQTTNFDQLTLDYTITSAAQVETLKFVSSIAACVFTITVEEEDTATGTWVAHGGGEVTVA